MQYNGIIVSFAPLYSPGQVGGNSNCTTASKARRLTPGVQWKQVKPVSLQAPILPAKDDARFQPLLAMAEQNWREHNPELVSNLEKDGTLKQTLESAVELTIISLQQSEQAGLSPDQARELAYENLLLPSPKE